VVDPGGDAHEDGGDAQAEQPGHSGRDCHPAGAQPLDQPDVGEGEDCDVAGRELPELLLPAPGRAVVREAGVLDGEPQPGVGLGVEVDRAEEDARRERPPHESAQLGGLGERDGR
jgi:hypothetical protein